MTGLEKINDIKSPLSNKELIASEHKYHSLFEQATDPIMLTDFKGNFIDVNTTMCSMFGYSKEELLRLNISSLVDAADLQASPIRFDLLADGQHIFSKRKMVHRDGTIVYVEANVKKFGDNLVMAIARDVTKLYEIQRQIEVSESTFRGAFENSSIGMSLNSPEGKWIRVNKQLCNITGYSESEMLKMGFSDITHPDDVENDLHNLRLCVSGKIDTYRVEKRYRHKNGSIIWIKLNTTLVRDNSGKPLYFIAQTEDITERKNVSEENDRIRYALNERVKELTTLYRFGQLLQVSERPIEELSKELVSVLPAGWQYPDITAARIVFGKKEFRTANFAKGPHKQNASFKTPGGIKVLIEVVYLEQKPAAQEGPFLAEERHLINMLAEMFRGYLSRKEKAEALKKSEANLHTIFDSTDTIYVLLDKKYRVLSFNKPAAEFAKREMKRVIRLNALITNYMPAERRPLFIKNMKKALAGEHIDYEVMYPQEDGSSRWYDTRILSVEGGNNEIFGLIVAVLDITEKKLLEIKILEQKVQEQKKISRAIINAQERERNFLGQELHDNVSQLLAGTKLHMRVAAQDNETVKKLIRYPMELIDNSIHEIRLLSSKQVTPLKDIRLKAMLTSLLGNWQKNTKIKIKFVYALGRKTLDDDVKLNIYRIIQEQVNNITKYAKAKHVSISVLVSKDLINVTVSDDGVGFNPNKKRKGIGISNMINRVNAFNGEVVIESAPGKGCKVRVSIPLVVPHQLR
ncbi:MAG: PAS domain S-box protein [Ferruginibacter sp.]